MAERQLPKLNVAGSIPVSRSIKSTTYKEIRKSLLHSCSVHFQLRPNLLETSGSFFSLIAPFSTMTNLRIKLQKSCPYAPSGTNECQRAVGKVDQSHWFDFL